MDATAQNIFDDAFKYYGTGAQWRLQSLEDPRVRDSMEDGDDSISDLVSMHEFLHGATRDLSSVKNTRILFDHNVVPDETLNATDIVELVKGKQLGGLPQHISPRSSLPEYAKVGIIISDHPDGGKSVLKIYEFCGEVPYPINMARNLLSGTGHVPVFRPGPFRRQGGQISR